LRIKPAARSDTNWRQVAAASSIRANPRRWPASNLVDSSWRATNEITVNEGNTTRARLQMIDSRGQVRDDYDGVFASLDTDVATIDTTGNITGKKAGFSTLTVTAGGIVTTATITVARLSAAVSGFDAVGVAGDLASRLFLRM
jgi:hypothetical protein